MKIISPPAIIPPENARVFRAFGEEIIFHFTGNETNNQLTMWTEITPPGGGPPPHYHVHEDEHFVVIEGRVSFFCNGQWKEIGPGGAVFMPRKIVHAFKNTGDKASRMIITTTPSGFETFFAHCEEEFAKPGGPNMERIVQLGAEYGIHFEAK
jgi:quercetin dioxygenase-like cupin family protein